jgi:adenine-specific DNA-methyltransferase
MMEKMKMQSPNLTDENIDKIAEIFPSCMTESTDEDGCSKQAIDFDLLRQELSTTIVEGPQERYHLNWPGKREALLTANAPIAKTLRPCRDESMNFDTTKNLFIEGDNLDALKLLQETYLGKVKMIYIDPPYNTGKDFIYADNFAESTEEYLLDSGQKDKEGNRLVANTDSNGRFHSDWLSMMYSRLKLARNLLKDDGVIFISIDDCEVHNLKKACDEIFGAEGFIANLIWEKRFTRNNDAKLMSNVTDHILLYRKSDALIKLREARTEKANSIYKNPDEDPRGPWTSVSFVSQRTKQQRPNLSYTVTNPFTNADVEHPVNAWKYSKEKYLELAKDNRLYWGVNRDNAFPRLKRFLYELDDGIVPINLWGYKETGTIDDGTKMVGNLLGKDIFDYPKPISLIQRMLYMGTNNGDIVLDFFGGSASTAHAVMQQNAEDGGNRKFIMVQLPEACDEKSEAFKAGHKTIAEISKERIRRAGKKIKEENATTTTDLDIGFRVLKVDSSNMADVYYTPDAIEQNLLNLQADNIKEDRTSEDLLFQVLLDWGVDLTLSITQETIDGCQVFFVDEDALAACFEKDGKITEDFCKELAERQPMRVVFRDSGFASDSVKINVEQIFKLKSPHTDVRTI